jgi:hypothetical protein
MPQHASRLAVLTVLAVAGCSVPAPPPAPYTAEETYRYAHCGISRGLDQWARDVGIEPQPCVHYPEADGFAVGQQLRRQLTLTQRLELLRQLDEAQRPVLIAPYGASY